MNPASPFWHLISHPELHGEIHLHPHDQGKTALIGSVESDFFTDSSPVKWQGNLELLPYPMPTCNAPTVEARL